MGLAFANPLPDSVKGLPSFSVTASVLGAEGRRVELVSMWDGAAYHKQVRVARGDQWETRVDGDAPDLTFQLDTAAIKFFWTGFATGDRYGFVTATEGRCAVLGLDGARQPQATIG